jgi:hypothetical protein
MDAILIERLDALVREVERLSAAEAIRQRVYGFSRALDRLDRELLAAQFWPDAEVDYGVFHKGGIAAFLDVALGFQGSMRDTHHLVGNVQVDVHGERAAAESYVQAHHVIVQGEDLVQLLVGARYLDRFERRGGEWRIAFRTEVVDWGRWLPVPERWFEQNGEMPKGRRDRDDLSYRYLLPR